jgi:hypothetical protein
MEAELATELHGVVVQVAMDAGALLDSSRGSWGAPNVISYQAAR